MLEFHDVTFGYEPGLTALAGVSLTLERGRVIAVVGANGSGKSTLARLANGLLLPRSGLVRVDGLDTRDPEHVWEIRRRVALVFQNPDNQIVATTVEEDVAFGPENLGLDRAEIRRRVGDALATVGLEGFETREPHLLSEGQKQRVALAGALAMRPDYLVLDEPASMLDAPSREALVEALRGLASAGHGLIHVTHHLEDLAWADEACALVAGEAAYLGPPSGLLADPVAREDAGLVATPAGILAEELRVLGEPIPAQALDAESVVEALWR